MGRRRFVSTAAGAGVGGLAGCIGGIFGDEEPTTYPANESRAFNDISYENGELMIDMNDVYPAVRNNGKHPDADEEIPARVRRVSSYELGGPEGEAIPRIEHQRKADILTKRPPTGNTRSFSTRRSRFKTPGRPNGKSPSSVSISPWRAAA